MVFYQQINRPLICAMSHTFLFRQEIVGIAAATAEHEFDALLLITDVIEMIKVGSTAAADSGQIAQVAVLGLRVTRRHGLEMHQETRRQETE